MPKMMNMQCAQCSVIKDQIATGYERPPQPQLASPKLTRCQLPEDDAAAEDKPEASAASVASLGDSKRTIAHFSIQHHHHHHHHHHHRHSHS